MADPGTSIRELVIANVVQTMRESELVRGVTDEEPFDYLRPDAPWSWVFEGDEVQDYQQIASKVECDLTVEVHQTFVYVPKSPTRDLYKLGRVLLAQMQQTMMADIRRGGHAFLTLERKNSIGRPVGTEAPIGVLATTWGIRYSRHFKNPYEK